MQDYARLDSSRGETYTELEHIILQGGILMSVTISKIPREEAVEAIFSKILRSPSACQKLSDAFYNKLREDSIAIDPDPVHFARILFSAYETQDISALLLEICQRSMFDLLRDSYLIPKRFHGKAGMNPVLLTDADGQLLSDSGKKVSHHEYAKFHETFEKHECAPRSRLYLADGYDIMRTYTDQLDINETLCNRRRGILALYALPDTASYDLSEAQAYAIIWDTFLSIQKAVPDAMVYYGQETGLKHEQKFDELGVLIPDHEFEKQILQHLQEIDGIVLACRENMMKQAGMDSLEL